MALSVTPTDEMKTLTVGQKIYEVVDDQAREDISEVKADLSESIPNLRNGLDTVIEDSGIEITHEKSITHAGTINQSLSKFDLILKSGTKVKITLIDANNIGYTVALYVRYTGQPSNTMLRGSAKVGTTYTYTLQNDTEFFSLHTSGATASTLLFQIVASNPANTTMLSRIGTLETEMDSSAPFGCVGFNVWDEEWTTNASGTYLKSKNLIPVIAGEVYYYKTPVNFANGVLFYDANGTQVGSTQYYGENSAHTVPDGACYMEFRLNSTYGTTYNNDICISISQPNEDIEPHNGQYVPYKYYGMYRDFLELEQKEYTLEKDYEEHKESSNETFTDISYKTGSDITNIFERKHETVLNQANSQMNISIPKNWSVTLLFNDSVEQNKPTSVYVRYKGEGSSVLLPRDVSLDGGSITFNTTGETEFISLYSTGLTKGTLEISIKSHVIKKFVDIPVYYEDHMVTKATEIRNNMMNVGKNGETFIFISDLHWENNNRNSPALVKFLLNNLNINYLLCGGDLINEGQKEAMSEAMVDCIRSFNIKNTFFPCAFGNHDSNKNENPQERWFNENAEYALMQKQAEDYITYFTDTGWNFYFDAEQTKTRWIVCDTQENGSFAWYDELCGLLNETPEDYHVIICGHWFYDSGAKSTFARNLESIVDAYNAGTTVTISGETYNFANPKGNILFVIGGHMHKDLDWTTPDGIPFILTDSDNGPRSGNTDYPYVKGTITEQAFDVVTVNYDANEKTVKCVRIGRGEDRDFTYGT